MKKIAIFVALALFAAGALFSASLTLIQPNGGELCLGQQNYQIKWTAPGVSEKIKLVLFRNGAKIAIIAENLEPGGSPYLWKVGQYMGGTAEAGGGYTIRLRTMDNSMEDFSDAAFSLATGSPPCAGSLPPPPPPVLLELETPNGGESWRLGTEHTISWTSTNLTGKVQLDLMIYKGETQQWMVGVIKDNLPVNGSHQWKAGEYSGQTVAHGQYRIRVRSMTNNAYSDSSDAPFNLISMVKLFKKSFVLKGYETVPGVCSNWAGRDTFPSNQTVPSSVHDGLLSQILPAVCYAGGSSHTAITGIYWFPYQNVQVAVVYRSRIIFYLSGHVQPGATLESAKLKMKRTHSIHEDANSGCGCEENLWVLKEPWTSYAIPAIGPRVDIDMGATEFTKDVTQIVKNWLDGTVVNNGLLLLAGESPCSGGRKCFSCYEASLLLYMK